MAICPPEPSISVFRNPKCPNGNTAVRTRGTGIGDVSTSADTPFAADPVADLAYGRTVIDGRDNNRLAAGGGRRPDRRRRRCAAACFGDVVGVPAGPDRVPCGMSRWAHTAGARGTQRMGRCPPQGHRGSRRGDAVPVRVVARSALVAAAHADVALRRCAVVETTHLPAHLEHQNGRRSGMWRS